MRPIIAAIITAVLLAGCANSEPAPAPASTPTNPVVNVKDGTLTVETIEVGGRNVNCVVFDGYRAGGVSCDFTRSAD